MLRNILFIIVVAFTFVACTDDYLTDQQSNLEGVWNQNDTKSFKVDITDSLQLYDFYIHLRNGVEYRNANVFLFLTTYFPNGQIAIDTIEYFVADRSGKWLGDGLGKYKDNQILFKEKGRFPMCGLYQFEFEQATRTENGFLEGLYAIGIRIEESKL